VSSKVEGRKQEDLCLLEELKEGGQPPQGKRRLKSKVAEKRRKGPSNPLEAVSTWRISLARSNRRVKGVIHANGSQKKGFEQHGEWGWGGGRRWGKRLGKEARKVRPRDQTGEIERQWPRGNTGGQISISEA